MARRRKPAETDPILAKQPYLTVRERALGPPDPRSIEQFRVLMPETTHRTLASCKDVDCKGRREGFIVPLDLTMTEHQSSADWIKRDSGRQFATFRGGEGGRFDLIDIGEVATNELGNVFDRTDAIPGLTYFAFPPGQDCFDSHSRSLEREPFFDVMRGYGQHIHDRQRVSGQEMVDRSQETLGSNKRIIERG
tara:strand:- start:923 stop:1501 length:579 start_codon:yes stop_codon:yes gene_type:complete